MNAAYRGDFLITQLVETNQTKLEADAGLMSWIY
jgi:hypothetical protein